jgi:heme/copper-type cytochrome/quinol oxidase subunit 2
MMKGNLVVESESAYQEWFGSKLAAAAEASGQEESERG